MSVYIIDNYDSFTFNLYQLIQEESDQTVVVIRNDRISFAELQAAKPSRVVISPGPGHPANDTDFGVCKQIVQQQDDLGCPVLGVCLGHQGIAKHLGGEVGRAPQIVHGKTSTVEIIEESAIFTGMSKQFQAMRYHSLIVQPGGLPECLKVTAREQAHGLIMAIEHKSRPLFGVQFHPESIGTPMGRQIIRNFLAI